MDRIGVDEVEAFIDACLSIEDLIERQDVVGPLRPGSSCLAPKQDRYTTSQGVLSLAEYNRRAREHRPLAATAEYRHLCETWMKYHHGDPRADTLYRHEQRSSRRIRDHGATLTRDDIESARGGEG